MLIFFLCFDRVVTDGFRRDDCLDGVDGLIGVDSLLGGLIVWMGIDGLVGGDVLIWQMVDFKMVLKESTALHCQIQMACAVSK